MPSTSTNIPDELSQFPDVVTDAKMARETMLQSETGYEAEEVRIYIKERIAGRKIERPQPKQIFGNQNRIEQK